MATGKDLTIAERLKNLYALQMIDSETDQIQILKGELPMEVKDLEDEIAGLETRTQKLDTQLDEMNENVSRHHKNIQEAEALTEKYNKQMDEVKNNREYDALTKEIELQKLEVQLSNKKIKEVEGQIALKKETREATAEKLESKKSELETKKVELEKIIEKTEKNEEKLRKKSEKQKKQVSERMLNAYEKIRTTYRNGLAVVTVERNSCGGCFNRIPPQTQLELAQRKKVIVCEHCGRILVDENIMTDLATLEQQAEEAAAAAK